MPDQYQFNRRTLFAQTGAAGLAATIFTRGYEIAVADSLLGERRDPVSPFIVMRASEFDLGARPIPADLATHSISIEVRDASGFPVDIDAGTIVGGAPNSVVCQIINLGAAMASAKALFIVADQASLDTVVAGSKGVLPFYGFADGIHLVPGETGSVKFDNVTLGEAGTTPAIVFQVWDSKDPVTSPLDAIQDRHIGRLNLPRIS